MMSDETQKRSTDCVYFLASPLTCKKGNDCEYRHSENARTNPRDCWYWLGGNCLNAARCPFRHPPLDGRSPTATTNTTTTITAAPSTRATNNTTTTTATTLVTPAIWKPAGVTTVSAYPSPVKSKLVSCYYFAQGYCSRGDKCAFLHGSLPLNPTPNNNNTTEVAQKSTQIASKPSVDTTTTTNGKQLGLTCQNQKLTQVASKASVDTTTATNWKWLGLTGQSQKSTQVASKDSLDTTTATNGKLLGLIGQSQKSIQVAGKAFVGTTTTTNEKQLGLTGQSLKAPEAKKPVSWNVVLPKVVPGSGATLEAVLIPKKAVKPCLNLPMNVDEIRLNEQVNLGLRYKRERDGMPRNGAKVVVDRIPNGGVHSRGESNSLGYGDADDEEHELRAEYEYPSMVLIRGIPTRGNVCRRDVYEEPLEAPSDYAAQKQDLRPLSDLRNHITKRRKIEGTPPSPPFPHPPPHYHQIYLQDDDSQRGWRRHKDDNCRHVGEISVRDRLGSPDRQGLLQSHGSRTAPLRSKRSYYDGAGFNQNNVSPDRNPKKMAPRNPTKEQSTPYLSNNKMEISGSKSADFSPPKSLAQIKAEKLGDGKAHLTTMKSQIFPTCKEDNTTCHEAKKIKPSNAILKEKGKPLLEVEAISNKGSLANIGSLVEVVVEEGEFFRRSKPHWQVQAKNRSNNGENSKGDASEYKENINGVGEGGEQGCLGMGSSNHGDEFDVGYNDEYAFEDDDNDEFARKIGQFFS